MHYISKNSFKVFHHLAYIGADASWLNFLFASASALHGFHSIFSGMLYWLQSWCSWRRLEGCECTLGCLTVSLIKEFLEIFFLLLLSDLVQRNSPLSAHKVWFDLVLGKTLEMRCENFSSSLKSFWFHLIFYDNVCQSRQGWCFPNVYAWGRECWSPHQEHPGTLELYVSTSLLTTPVCARVCARFSVCLYSSLPSFLTFLRIMSLKLDYKWCFHNLAFLWTLNHFTTYWLVFSFLVKNIFEIMINCIICLISFPPSNLFLVPPRIYTL